MTQARRTGPALETMYRFLLWLVPAVEKFPRRQKFLLGDRNRNSQRIGEHFQSSDQVAGRLRRFPPLAQGMLQAVNGAPLL